MKPIITLLDTGKSAHSHRYVVVLDNHITGFSIEKATGSGRSTDWIVSENGDPLFTCRGRNGAFDAVRRVMWGALARYKWNV